MGSTENLAERLKLHNAGLVKSTKAARPWDIVYSERFYYLRDASKREFQVKKWKSRAALERLIGKAEI